MLSATLECLRSWKCILLVFALLNTGKIVSELKNQGLGIYLGGYKTPSQAHEEDSLTYASSVPLQG